MKVSSAFRLHPSGFERGCRLASRFRRPLIRRPMPPRYSPSTTRVVPGSPFLTSIALREDRVVPGTHLFDIPILSDGLTLTLSSPVTFLVG